VFGEKFLFQNPARPQSHRTLAVILDGRASINFLWLRITDNLTNWIFDITFDNKTIQKLL